MSDLHEAYEANRDEIARQVEAVIDAVPADETLSLSTFLKVRENGSVSIYQPCNSVTLTPSQVEAVMERIGAAVRKAEAAL